jgi:phosphoglycerate dehydrogenase-like enzyme
MTALVHSHRYPKLYEWQKDHHWGKGDNHADLMHISDMVGQRLGVLGYGSIGRQVGRVAKAMGMDVIAYTAGPRDTKESKRDRGFIVPGTGDPEGDIPSAWFSGLEKAKLHEFLRQDIDHLLVSVPLTKETTHLGKEEFEILGKSRNSFVSNISRGQILQQADLIEALKKGPENGGLRGAALDVADPNRCRTTIRCGTRRMIVTPHISGLGTAYVDRAFQVLEVNLTRKEKGKKLINVVDRKRGY